MFRKTGWDRGVVVDGEVEELAGAGPGIDAAAAGPEADEGEGEVVEREGLEDETSSVAFDSLSARPLFLLLLCLWPELLMMVGCTSLN